MVDEMPGDPDQRENIERQGNYVFWITLVAGLLVVIIALVYSLVL
jgi:hypothetical protein